MEFNGFTNADFEVFTIDGLDERMDALKTNIRPKLDILGSHFAPTLSVLVGEEIYAHVAKHARRTINPPKDTWVAFANNNRGYKMLPHFQIGLWETHLFIWFAVIYEATNKSEFGKTLELNATQIYNTTPKDFVWSVDHMKPDVKKHETLSKEELINMFVRLQSVKKAEILCGSQILRQDVVKMSGEQLINHIDSVFKQLTPLYKMF
jgi:uncharacterized protein YktB (UPF0637 family)